ncbi:hypothetical protein B0H11DRAFT_1951290 [Mycena galericulata]|nr:hypothetical protein B0H11DRAFT_1951290 [Mycena galericulata]
MAKCVPSTASFLHSAFRFLGKNAASVPIIQLIQTLLRLVDAASAMTVVPSSHPVGSSVSASHSSAGICHCLNQV